MAEATASVTDPRSAPARVLAFAMERFPPLPQVILVMLLWMSGLAMAVTMWAPVRGVTPGQADLSKLAVSAIGALLVLFHLRVFDDVKDADTDRVENPTRPIPRGLVTERECDVLSIILLAAEAVLFSQIGMLAFAVWVVVAAYTVLMRLEFFVGHWLDRHVLTFATSHMFAMALILASLVAAGIDSFGMSAHGSLGNVLASADITVACLAAFVIGTSFELGRKFERYVAQHGLAAWLLWALSPVAAVLMFAWATADHYAHWVTWTLVVTAAVTLVANLVMVARRPVPAPTREDAWEKGVRETIEMLPGLAGLVTYGVLAWAGAQAINF